MAEMTNTGRFLPPRPVAVWMPPGSQLLGLVGFLEALDAANRISVHQGRSPLYAPRVVGTEADTPTASGAVVRVAPSRAVDRVHTLVVGGMLEMAEAPIAPAVLAEVGRLASTAERVVSVCMGAFVLGELGWLDGRRCTTHWLALDALRRRFPAALVEDDAIHTEDGPVLTSAGASAGIDLALHLIRRDAGQGLALAVARTLVVFAQRPGGQSQFGSAVQARKGTDDRLARLMAAVRQDPGGDHRVEVLSRHAGMSPRHFARVFRAQTGQTPAAFVSQVRVEAAQRALAASDAGLDLVASDCGFGSVETFRRTFHRVAGTSPSSWRARFRAP